MCTIKIILPTKLPKYSFFFKGYVKTYTDSSSFSIFVTKINLQEYEEKTYEKGYDKETYLLYGMFERTRILEFDTSLPNYLHLQDSKLEYPRIVSFRFDSCLVHTIDNLILVFYDYNQFESSESLFNGDSEYSTLQKLIQGSSSSFETKSENKESTSYWLTSSMLCQHIYNYVFLLKWFVNSIRRDRKISIKHGNLIVAVLTDIIVGYLVIEFLTPDKEIVKMTLMENLEKLVNSMYSLLKWLMGAPAGLKLNNAFNKMLGKYFSYHVQLWWLFIDISGEKSDIILEIYHCISYLGITFQAALISDLICVVTFHSYCFYVYAAKLFNLQISGLIALLRLFVGRKYNPLRNGIDSCEYTNQELFVGTVAFTILLLLIPTTAMYYIVFTTCRLLSLLIQYILAKSIYWIQTLPLYVIMLKMINSPKVAGDILVEVLSCDKNSLLVLRIKLFGKSIDDLVNNFKPPVQISSQMEWTGLLSKIFTGKPIG